MGFRSFDFFQKIAMENVSKSTYIGSMLSITAIIIMIYLLFRQLIDFYSPHIITNAVISQPDNAGEQIEVNMNIHFPDVPCNLMSLDMVDIMNNHRGDIRDSIKKYVIKNGETVEEYKPLPYNPEHLFEAIKQKKGCAFIGKIFISQVPGEFHFSYHNYRALWNALNSQRKDLTNNIKLTHIINSMNFGSTTEYKIKKFGLSANNFFREFKEENYLDDHETMNYAYFIKVIPYILYNENRGATDYSYSFSLTSKSTNFNKYRDDMPLLSFRYDFSPIYMKVTYLNRDYLHFLTHISAIIGGVFVVFSVMNTLLTNLFDFGDKN